MCASRNRNRRLRWTSLVFWLWLGMPVLGMPLLGGSVLVAQEASATGSALSSILNVRRAPAARSMGLFQGSFLESFAEGNRSMQLAVVLDSTESMSGELNAIRENLPNLLSDLYQITDGSLETAIVSYTDTGMADRPASILSRNFLIQPDEIKTVIDQIRPATGKPYFPEAVDLGIFTAIEQLNWSDEEDVEKWIMLIGDAPPYESDFSDPKTKAKRWYETDFLVDRANERKVKIHCMLCNSRPEEQSAYNESLDKTQRFMSRLADGTGGLMLDLSYPHVREKLSANVSRQRAEYTRVGFITQYDIDSVKAEELDAAREAPAILRVAVLPFLPLESISFLYSKPEVQLAAEIRKTLESLPQLRTASARQIEREILRLQGEGVDPAEWPQALCFRLRLDHVIHGKITRSQGLASATMDVFGPSSQEPLVRTTASGENAALGSLLIRYLKDGTVGNDAAQSLVSQLQTLETDSEGQLKASAVFAGLDAHQRSLLIGSFDALEQTVDLVVGDPRAQAILQSVEKQLGELLAVQRDQAFAHVLLASCLYNQARNLENEGQLEAARDKFRAAINAIERAFALRAKIIDPLTRLEIEGDYHLLVNKDFPAAIAKYEAIIAYNEASPVHPALRAHWMLAGIRSGDWQAAEQNAEVVDAERARWHLIQVLAHWPDSPAAKTIKRNLLWDEKQKKNRSPYLPQEADILAAN